MDESSSHSGFALVTGASRGIGREIAIALARQGLNILVNYYSDLRSAEVTADLVSSMNVKALVFQADVTNRSQVLDMLSKGLAQLGSLKVLVNNAGILCRTPFDQITDDDWNSMVSVNLNSAFVCTQEASRLIDDGGSIVNISSVGGQLGGPKAPHYAAAKGALLTFTKSTAKLLALELE